MVKISVNQIIWDDWNINHIKKHKLEPKEIKQALKSKTKSLKSYNNRLLILGRTKAKRLLIIVLAPEKDKQYYLITTRDMSKKERRYYE